MTTTFLLLIVSLVLLVFGADKLVDGASAIARKAGISEFVIGLTIIGFGTSCPELVVSLTGALEGIPDVSVGNVLGSNIFNTLLILGLTAVLTPIAITPSNRKRDIPLCIFVSAIFVVYLIIGKIDRISGIGFLVLFAAYMFYCFKADRGADEEVGAKPMKLWLAIFWTIFGLFCLIFFGSKFVDASVEIARHYGMSEKFIAITLLAGGTSLPELVTCIVAAAKHKGQLALGNILGSNIFNILLILGCSAVVRPVDCGSMNWIDASVLMASILLVFLSIFTWKKNTIDRADGAVMLLCEAGYMAWLICSL